MKKAFNILIMVTLCFGVTSLNSFAGGPANKVTGDFVRLNDYNQTTEYECEISAHEAKNNRKQKGTMYCKRIDEDNWWEIDLSAENSCVFVVEEGYARVGGMVNNAEGNTLLGNFVGFEIYDLGEPGAYVDSSRHGIWDDENRALNFGNWCEYGDYDDARGPYYYTVIEGNLQVHFY